MYIMEYSFSNEKYNVKNTTLLKESVHLSTFCLKSYFISGEFIFLLSIVQLASFI